MFRLPAALLAASVSLAADPPKPASAEMTVVTVTVKNGLLVWQETKQMPVQQAKQVTEVVNGQKVTKTVNEIVYITQAISREKALKDMKAVGPDGKAKPADEVEKKLKDGGTVVMHTGTLGDDLRKVFKDGTIIFDQTPAPSK